MTTLYLRNIGRILFLSLFIYTVFCSFVSASSPPVASPAASTELICHTDNPAECYPKVFSATEEFQIVHDDQDLPPGLHVQLDVQTGKKQAKLYNPDEENPALAGLPVDRDVIVVDPEPPQDNEPRIPAGAPAYEPVGVIKAPRERNEDFSQALQTIKKASEQRDSVEISVLDEALGLLDDLSHDMYYGLQIAEDMEAVQSLFCLLLRREEAEVEGRPFTEQVNFVASSILSAAVGNNARALAAIEKSWDSITGKQCEAELHSIQHELFHRLAPTSEPGTKSELQEVENIRVHLTVISGLLKSPKIRTEFLENNGMQNFLRVLLRDGEAWESRKAKVAQITSDTFLDEDFGATLGLWPRKHQAGASICAGAGSPSFDDECWEHHLENIGQGAGAPEWSEHLLSLIRQAQIPGLQPKMRPERNEL
ncbi:putative nucleotide exchange factor SIL1 [Rosellinia necatrix]|uniref:Nucleotide exchange factor SIL1 n=1 Tax=Rosellinia necatrix TaxID=77044 RepID=A0A1W2TGR7_ROSNE|nr:putative nucleotide exchange factor SIL1 [Rosellinia necatrix]